MLLSGYCVLFCVLFSCLLFVVSRLLCVGFRGVLCVVCWLLLVVCYCVWSDVCCLKWCALVGRCRVVFADVRYFVVCCALFVVECCLLCVVCCVLFGVVYLLLFDGWCLLFVV